MSPNWLAEVPMGDHKGRGETWLTLSIFLPERSGRIPPSRCAWHTSASAERALTLEMIDRRCPRAESGRQHQARTQTHRQPSHHHRPQ
jgi:hypothetical protein